MMAKSNSKILSSIHKVEDNPMIKDGSKSMDKKDKFRVEPQKDNPEKLLSPYLDME